MVTATAAKCLSQGRQSLLKKIMYETPPDFNQDAFRVLDLAGNLLSYILPEVR